jgi:DUF971 family protein
MPADEKSPYGVPTPNQARGPHDDSVTPADLKVKLAEQKLIVEWKDGRRSEFSLDELRRICPCATCRTEREQSGHSIDNRKSTIGNPTTGGTIPLQVLKRDPTGVRVVSAKLVGTYAIQFDWSDGHNTGIFDFRFLRSLT